MKRILKIAFIIMSTTIISCKKDRYCACSSPLIDSQPFIIHDTKQSAKKKCEAYNQPSEEFYCKLK